MIFHFFRFIALLCVGNQVEFLLQKAQAYHEAGWWQQSIHLLPKESSSLMVSSPPWVAKLRKKEVLTDILLYEPAKSPEENNLEQTKRKFLTSTSVGNS